MNENLTLSGAANHRGTSKQDYATPAEFMRAVEAKFGTIDFDLAASLENAKAAQFFDESDNSLAQYWNHISGRMWLNPPFRNIAPWAKKCAETVLADAEILFLIPASVDSNWWMDHVHNQAAAVHFCNPRLSFDGKNPFPKPMALCHYKEFWRSTIYQPWRWKP